MNQSGVVVVLLLSVSGCVCGEGTTDIFGDARWRSADTLRVENSDAWLDFGGVRFGTSSKRTVYVDNVGRGSLQLRADTLDAPFSTHAIDVTVSATGAQEIEVLFSAVDDGTGLGTNASTSTLPIEVLGEAQPRTLTLHLSGIGFGARCALPESLDFGVVAIGDSEQRSFVIQNATPESVTADFHELSDGFSWPGSVALAANSEGTIDVTFAPTEPREYSVDALARASTDCPYTTVHLVGRGVSTLLSWEPSSIDCGWVPLGASIERSVQFHNFGLTPVVVHQFTMQGPASTDDVELTVPAQGSAEQRVRCEGVALGVQSASLHFTTSLVSPSAGVVPITFRGGGPQIELQPSPLNFGRAVVDVPTTRRFFVRNVGANAALELEADGGVPVIEMVIDASISPNDVRVTAAAYDGGIAVGTTLPVDVTFTPREERLYEFTLALKSNDPLTPRAELPVKVNGIALPPCQLSVQPTELDFGIIQEGETRTRNVTLTNIASYECIVTSIDIADNTATFLLVGGRREMESLLPGASLELSILEQGTGPLGARAAQLTFEVSDPVLPQRSVLLHAFGTNQCFTVAPEPLDFGPTPIGCSATRAVTVYNTCDVPLSVGGASVLRGAAFTVDGGATVSLPIAGAASLFVNFAPTAVGAVDGELSLSIDSQSRLHPVLGEGVLLQQITETFVQPAVSRTDILFAVSHPSGQSELGAPPNYDTELSPEFRARMSGVLDVMRDAGVDFHAGVISGLWDRETWEFTMTSPIIQPPPWFDAELIPPFDGGARFATSSMTSSPSLVISESMLRATPHAWFATIDVNGACFEMFVRSLSPRRTNGTNAGFRRPGVHLSLICQTVYGDFSTIYRPDNGGNTTVPYLDPLPVGYYSNALSNVAGTAGWDFSVIGHVPGPPDCSTPTSDWNGRLAEMVQLTGGTIVDSCDPDGASALAQLRGQLESFNRQFVLRGTPDISAPMFVTVDGVTLSPSDWLLRANNTIELTVAPAPNASVVVAYVPRCIP
jgi:hypothetical protein